MAPSPGTKISSRAFPLFFEPVQLDFQPADFFIEAFAVRLAAARFTCPAIHEEFRHLLQGAFLHFASGWDAP